MKSRKGVALAFALLAACSDDGPTEAPTAPAGDVRWAMRFGKTTNMDRVGMAVDASGSAIVAGRFFATTDFGGGPVTSPINNWQLYVAKYDAAGLHLWSRSFGDMFEEAAAFVAVDGAGNAYVAGTFSGALDFGGEPLESTGFGYDIFLVKLDPSGNPLWSRRIDLVGGYGSISGLGANAAGDVALAGSSDAIDVGDGPVPIDAGAFLARFNPAGAPLFAMAIGETNPADYHWISPGGVGVDGSGATFFGGSLYGTLRLDGQVVQSSPDDDDAFVTKLDADGGLVWHRAVDGAEYGDSAPALAIDADGRVIVAGELQGIGTFAGLNIGVPVSLDVYTSSMYAVALGSDGSGVWSHTFTAYGPVEALGVAAGPSGTVALTGSFGDFYDYYGGMGSNQSVDLGSGTVANLGREDAFVVKLDGAGAPLWSAVFANEDRQSGYAVAFDASGGVRIAGTARGALSIPAGQLTGSPYFEQFVVDLAP